MPSNQWTNIYTYDRGTNTRGINSIFWTKSKLMVSTLKIISAFKIALEEILYRIVGVLSIKNNKQGFSLNNIYLTKLTNRKISNKGTRTRNSRNII